MRTHRTMNAVVTLHEIRRRLSWVNFLAPLSEEELDNLARSAAFVRLKKGEVLSVGPEEQAERMLIALARGDEDIAGGDVIARLCGHLDGGRNEEYPIARSVFGETYEII